MAVHAVELPAELSRKIFAITIAANEDALAVSERALAAKEQECEKLREANFHLKRQFQN